MNGNCIKNGLEKYSKENNKTDLKIGYEVSVRLCEDDAQNLRAILKKYRNSIAVESNMPSYCIFDDKTLEDIIKYLPQDIETIVEVHGLRKKRIEKYGKDIIEIIKSFPKTKPKMEEIEQKSCDEEIVLECIKHFNNQFSLQGIIKILIGYKPFKNIPNMEESKYFGILSEVAPSKIKEAIDYLISKKIVKDDCKLRIL